MQSTIYKNILLLLICLFVIRIARGQDLSVGADLFSDNNTHAVTVTNPSSFISNDDNSSNKNSSSNVQFQNITTSTTNTTTSTGYPPHSQPVQQRNVQYGLAMLYVFLFICILFVPFFYYNLFRCWFCKCCTDPSSDRNNSNDEEQGRHNNSSASSQGAIRFNIHAVSQNHHPPIRNLFTSSATYGYTANNNTNVSASYVDRTENGILKRKYIEEKIAQLRQLLVPYKLTLTEDNFPTRSIFNHSQSALSETRSVENRRTSKTIRNIDEESCLETDDATTCTNESTTGNCEEEYYCSKNNNKQTNNKDKGKTTNVKPQDDSSHKQGASSTAETSNDFYDRFDLSDNPYGDEDSLMIKVPRAGVTITDYENATLKSKSDEDVMNKSNSSVTNKKFIQSDRSESSSESSSSSASTLAENPVSFDDVESQQSSPRVPSPGSHVARLEMSLARLLNIASGEGPQYESSKIPEDNDEVSKLSRVVPGICSICLSTYRVGNEVVWSSNPQCEHVFHYECMEPWLMKQKDGPFCPCCRQEFVLDPVEKVLKEDGMGTTIDLDNSIVDDEGDRTQDIVHIALTAPSTEDNESVREESHHTRGIHI